jgi:hypothetical protein
MANDCIFSGKLGRIFARIGFYARDRGLLHDGLPSELPQSDRGMPLCASIPSSDYPQEGGERDRAQCSVGASEFTLKSPLSPSLSRFLFASRGPLGNARLTWHLSVTLDARD